MDPSFSLTKSLCSSERVGTGASCGVDAVFEPEHGDEGRVDLQADRLVRDERVRLAHRMPGRHVHSPIEEPFDVSEVRERIAIDVQVRRRKIENATSKARPRHGRDIRASPGRP
jgi:hypothetical protein